MAEIGRSVSGRASSALSASFRPEVEVGGEPTRVLVERLRALDEALTLVLALR